MVCANKAAQDACKDYLSTLKQWIQAFFFILSICIAAFYIKVGAMLMTAVWVDKWWNYSWHSWICQLLCNIVSPFADKTSYSLRLFSPSNHSWHWYAWSWIASCIPKTWSVLLGKTFTMTLCDLTFGFMATISLPTQTVQILGDWLGISPRNHSKPLSGTQPMQDLFREVGHQ